MFTKNKYTIYFYLILFFIVSLLLITANYSLSISYKEALNLYYNSSILSIIINSFTYIFGHNDLADATLMYIANKENIKNIVSIDSDFDIYRTLKKQSLNNLLK
jgi:hypothetical protein